MTSCCQYSDLKSSVYNQTGEGYFDQLKAYNHMTTHLKKVYQAKCVVDSRNQNYLINKQQRCRSLCRDKSLEKCTSQDVIDRLAFDTQHHPIDVLRMGCNINNNCKICTKNIKKPYFDSYYSGCHKTTRDTNHRSRSRTRICSTAPSFHSARPDKCIKKRCKNQTFDVLNQEVEISITPADNRGQLSNRSSPRSTKSRYNDDPTCSNYASSFETSPDTSRNTSPVANYSQMNKINKKLNKNTSNTLSDDEKYSTFLYEITQEIVQNKYYTDDELKNVFKKHMRQNSGTLDRNKMLYEIYQLKLSLNMNDNDNDDEDDEQIEDFLQSQKYTSKSPVKPPTPPKILDENKIIDKIKNQDELKKTYSRSPNNGRNTVVLVDANPELLVTERDILITLMEMNLDAQQVNKIYRKLQNKSKDLFINKNDNKLSNKYVQSRFTKCGSLQNDKCNNDNCELSNDSNDKYSTEEIKSLFIKKSSYNKNKNNSIDSSINYTSGKLSDEIKNMYIRSSSLKNDTDGKKNSSKYNNSLRSSENNNSNNKSSMIMSKKNQSYSNNSKSLKNHTDSNSSRSLKSHSDDKSLSKNNSDSKSSKMSSKNSIDNNSSKTLKNNNSDNSYSSRKSYGEMFEDEDVDDEEEEEDDDDNHDNASLENNSELRILKCSDDRSRSKSADERLQSIQEVSVENDTQIISDEDEENYYSSDEDIEEEVTDESEDDDEAPSYIKKSNSSKSNVSLSDNYEESIDEDLNIT